MDSIIAVIPARGGSKGIPRKNLITIGGLSLVGHAIQAARGASSIDRIFVSTEDAQIAAASRMVGAEIIDRPAEISGDTASSEAALFHALDAFRAESGCDPEIIVFLQCTSPFTTSGDIERTIQAVRDGADCALSVVQSHRFLWKKNNTAGAEGINHLASERKRRQEREPEFVETGAIYVMRVAGFRKSRHRFFGQIALVETPRSHWLEIDDLDDVAVADAMFLAQSQSRAASRLPDKIMLVVFDFDGVMTDNGVIVLEDGREAVVCNRSDGMGVDMLRAAGVDMLVLSTEVNGVVSARCRKLGIPCVQNLGDKAKALRIWAVEKGIDLSEVVYVGNDVNDLGCLKIVGCAVAVGDAYPEVKSAADIVLSKDGGHGAVRELADLILSARK